MANIFRRSRSGRLRSSDLVQKKHSGVSQLIASEFFEYTAPIGGGISMKVNVGGVWKDVVSRSVNIGGSWKTVVAMSVNIGGSWKGEV